MSAMLEACAQVQAAAVCLREGQTRLLERVSQSRVSNGRFVEAETRLVSNKNKLSAWKSCAMEAEAERDHLRAHMQAVLLPAPQEPISRAKSPHCAATERDELSPFIRNSSTHTHRAAADKPHVTSGRKMCAMFLAGLPLVAAVTKELPEGTEEDPLGAVASLSHENIDALVLHVVPNLSMLIRVHVEKLRKGRNLSAAQKEGAVPKQLVLFAQSMMVGSMRNYEGGVTGRVSEPNVDIWRCMKIKHTQRADAYKKFVSPNYHLETYPHFDYIVVISGSLDPEVVDRLKSEQVQHSLRRLEEYFGEQEGIWRTLVKRAALGKTEVVVEFFSKISSTLILLVNVTE